MTLKKLSLIALLVAGTLVWSGCGGPKELVRPPQSEIDAYIQANPDLPALDRRCLDDGRLDFGMLASTVRFMMGEPTTIEQVKQPWAAQEHWTYGKKGKVRIFYIEGRHVVGIDERNK